MNKITIPDKVRDEILQLRTDPQAPNMFDTAAVQRLALDRGYFELADLSEISDKSAYQG